MYYKTRNMLLMLRQVFDYDSLWRATLCGLTQDFRHQWVSSAQIELYLSEAYGEDLTPFFDQYLRNVRIPTLEYALRDGRFFYRWTNTQSLFSKPVKVRLKTNG